MLNYTDVLNLRQQGQTNRQILEMMAPVVPSAKKVLDDIDRDTVTPKWQVDAKIGQMLDKSVPKNAPSGIAYLQAIGLNKAQERFDSITNPTSEPIQTATGDKYENPGWLNWVGKTIGNTAKSLFEASQAPGNVIAGTIEKGIGGIAGAFGAKSVQGTIDQGPDVQNLSRNAITALNSMPLYAGIVGASFGMPGVGAGVGQAITELGHDAIGDNPNTIAQQFSNTGLTALQGWLLGSTKLGGPTNVPGMALKGALGQAAQEGGRAIMGNNPNDLGQAISNVAGAGLVTGGLTAGFNVGSPAVSGAIEGAKTGVTNAIEQGAKGVVQGVQDIGKQFYPTNPLKFLQRFHSTPNVDNYIQTQWDKAVRPGVGVKRTQQQIQDYNGNVNLAVKEIVANKEHLQLSSLNGEPMEVNSLPNSLWTASQANGQMMDKLFSAWDNLKKITSGKGVTVPSEPMAKALDEIAANKVMRTQYPNTAQFAENLAVRLREQLPEITMEQAQQMSQQWNAELKQYQLNANPNEIANGTVTAVANNILKKTLADAIQKETNSPIYTELKRSYAAQKAVETDLNRRVATFYRQNPRALIDYTDMWSVGDALHGLASFNPGYIASAAGRLAIKNWIKALNNPDNMITNMFQAVDKHLAGTKTPILTRAQQVIEKQGGTPPADGTPEVPLQPPSGSAGEGSRRTGVGEKKASPPTVQDSTKSVNTLIEE